MWTRLVILLVALAAAIAQPGWKTGNQYTYEVTSTTLTGLQSAPQYAGLLIKAQLVISPTSETELIAAIVQPQKAHVHTYLEKGKEFRIPEEVLKFQPFALSKQSFIIRLKDGVVDEVVISKEVPIWEVNIIRSIVSQFQVDSRGKRLIPSKLNMVPETEKDPTALYKVFEDTVEGDCEVLYDITRLPATELLARPHLAPLNHVGAEMINIVKTKNFTNCEHRPGYHFGITGIDHWEPSTNKMGRFLSRSSICRLVVEGNLNAFTIHSSVTTNEVILSPEMYNHQKGTVLSRVNVTLVARTKAEQKFEAPAQPQKLGSLVYDYNSPTVNDQEARLRWDRRNELATGKKERFGRSVTKSSESSSSESKSVSTEAWHQEIPKLSLAPESPFLPYFVGCDGHSIQKCDNVEIVSVAKKLCEQIVQQLRDTKVIPQARTLERYSILTRVIRTMNLEQLQRLTEELWVKGGEKETETADPHYAYWTTYRDAVAQAGTGPALMVIKEWILNDKIQGEEAAQVVSSLALAAMQPTAEYMKTFFTLVKDPKVVDQPCLNSSAIFTFTKLVRMALVDRRTMHNRYPVHAFGRLTPSGDAAVVQEYIPYFAQRLETAVQQQDSPVIQVCIRALGNIAHPKILEVFEPYLEGRKPMTDFERSLVIVSLHDLAVVHPRTARSVLYKTYVNVGEVHQVRVAAVYNLMRTVPPVNILQRMAQSTHTDPSIQVRSAVKSAIESAALLKNPENEQLRKNAQAAVNMLTPRVYGVHYARSNITDFVLRGLNVAYADIFEYIGSEDSILPSTILYTLRSHLNGYQGRLLKFGVMFSSIQDLVDLFESTFALAEGSAHGKTGKDHEWTYEKITRMLNVEHESQKQVEGNILYNMYGAQRFFAFDNRTIESVAEKLLQLPHRLGNGYRANYQKLYHLYNVQIGFPTATGLPFVYTLEKPHALLGKAKLQMQTQKSTTTTTGKGSSFFDFQQVTGTVYYEGVHTSSIQAEIGFVAPFEHRRYISGLYKQYLGNLAGDVNYDVNLKNNHVKVEVTPFAKTDDRRVLHYSSRQYTSILDVTEFKPAVQAPETKIIKIRQPHKFEYSLSEKYSCPLRVVVESETKHLDFPTLYTCIMRHNMITPYVYPTATEYYDNTDIDVHYDQAYAKAFVIGVGIYGTETTRKHGKSGVQIPAHVQQVLTSVRKGIKAPEAVAADFSWEIKGGRNIKYTTVGGYGFSPIDEEYRFMLRHQKTGGEKNYEACIDAAAKMPYVPETDFAKAVENQPKGQVAVDLRFGEKCQSGTVVNLSGKFERTPERTQYLQRLPQVEACKRQMTDGNNLLSACSNATYNANLLDRYTFNIKYDNVPVYAKNFTYHVYSFLRQMGYQYAMEKMTPQGGEGNRIEWDVHFSPDLRSVDTRMVTPMGVSHFKNIRVNKYFRTILVTHPTWSVVRRFGWSALRQQYKGYCTVDKTAVKTFDNMTYTGHTGNHWSTVFVSVPKINEKGQYVGLHKVAVLMKETTDKQKEVQIISNGISDEFGVVMHVKPTSGKVAGTVQLNGQDIQVTDQEVYEYRTPEGMLVVRAHALPTGQLKFLFPECDFEVLYDRVRLQIHAGQIYKNRVLGLCGDYNGEDYDFITPKGKFVRDPEEFVASWALTNDGNIAQLKERVEKNSVRKNVILTGVVSDQDAGRVDMRGRQYTKEQLTKGYYDSSSSSSSESTETPCMNKQITVIERDGKYCFSTTPQNNCKPGCQVEKTQPMTTKFVCVEKTQTSSHWAQMVTRGAMPNLGDKQNYQELTFQAPVECSQNL